AWNERLNQAPGAPFRPRAPARHPAAALPSAGEPEAGAPRLSGPVDGTAEDRDFECLLVGREALFDPGGELLDADVVAAAGRAGDQDRPALPQAERLEDLEPCLDLLDRVGGEGDADRVPDPVHEQRAHAD